LRCVALDDDFAFVIQRGFGLPQTAVIWLARKNNNYRGDHGQFLRWSLRVEPQH